MNKSHQLFKKFSTNIICAVFFQYVLLCIASYAVYQFFDEKIFRVSFCTRLALDLGLVKVQVKIIFAQKILSTSYLYYSLCSIDLAAARAVHISCDAHLLANFGLS